MKIQIIGNGNVATHLYNALTSSFQVSNVSSRTLDGFDISSDISIICVKDDAIIEVANKIFEFYGREYNGIIAHTSGSKSISLLDIFEDRAGVLYPLQTFSKDISLDYKSIPFFVEGKSEKTRKSLLELGMRISGKVTEMDSRHRIKMHIASVFICNFTNHLLTLGDEILKDCGINFDVMVPLLRETMRKAENTGSPFSTQTGPAIRKDKKVIDSHINILEEDFPGNFSEIYKLLSKSIIETYR